MERLRPPAALCATLLVLAGCAGVGRFVWVDDYPAPPRPPAPDYVIARGDILSVRVWNQEVLSASRLRVREDGKISLTFLNDVEAAGHTPSALSLQLQTRLKDFINNPIVTVALEDPRPLAITVLGEVGRPGPVQLDPEAGMLQALAGAGGFTEYAHKDRIFVLRREPDAAAPTRIRFTYDALIHLEGRAPTFRFRSSDVVVVE